MRILRIFFPRLDKTIFGNKDCKELKSLKTFSKIWEVGNKHNLPVTR